MTNNYKKLEAQYAPKLESLDEEIRAVRIHLAYLVAERSKLIKEYIEKNVGVIL